MERVLPLAYKNGVSIETRNKMSLAASKRNASRTYTKGVGGIRKDIGHYVRSRWEANFARYLLYTGYQYEYETRVFILQHEDKTIRYTPDFKVEDRFYEVKGWWDPRSLLIKQLMSQQYPDVNIKYIDEEVYLKIEDQFKEKINEWETQ